MLEDLIAEIIGFFLWILNISINSTVRIHVINEEIIDKSHEHGKKIIFAFWHGLSFPALYYYRYRKMCIMPISALRGKIMANFAKKFGYKIIHYPESGTPGEKIQSTKRILNTLKEGYDLALAVDGPPDPKYHKVKPGVLFFSQKTNHPLVPSGIYMERKITLFWRWDRYEIPLPFSRVTIVFGDPLEIPVGLEIIELEKKTRELEEKLQSVNRKAKEAALASKPL